MASNSLTEGPRIILEDLPKVPNLAKAHGIVMGLAFVIAMPLGAFLVRTLRCKYTVWIHAVCQLTAVVLMVTGLATGIRLAKIIDMLHDNSHTILGTAIVAGLFLQPFLGYIHHRRYLKTKRPTAWGAFHVWYGRALIILGIINGGLGLQLASESPAYSQAGMVVYFVLAGIAGVSLISLVVYVMQGRCGGGKAEAESNEGD
ncbi:hypothetical protein OQA88_1414 [Cercophora sp. LCS_1]